MTWKYVIPYLKISISPCQHYFIQSQALESRSESDAATAALDKAHELYKQISSQAEPARLTLQLLNGIVAPCVW
jgi:hypothetical protein